MNTLKSLGSITLAAMLLTCAAAPVANAQFRSLGNKVKNKAEQVVKEKVDEKANNTATTVAPASTTTTTTTTTSVAGFDYRKTYAPSAEAIAADPLATSSEVQKGYTKSVGAIHAAYENMPDEILISYFKPYYSEGGKIWYDLSPDAHNRLMYIYMTMFNDLLSATMDRPLAIGSYAEVSPGVQIPVDEAFKNAWTLQFIADPTSSAAFQCYLYAYAYKAYSNYPWLSWQQPAGSVLPSDYTKKIYARDDMAFELATTVLPYSVLQQWADSFSADIDNTDKPFAKFFYWIMADKVLNVFMPRHKDHTPTDAYRAQVAQFEAKYGNGNVTFGDVLSASKKEAVAEPRGVAVSAEIKAMGNKAGKEIAYGEFEKLIYHDSKWTVLKESQWPYKVTGYYIPVSIVYTKGGKRWVLKGSLVKAPQGNHCFVQNDDPSTANPLK